MTEQEFWLSLVSNTLATLIAGTVLGVLATIWVNRKLAREEKIKNDVQKWAESIRKKFEYYQIIKSELEDLQKYVSELSEKKLNPEYIHLDTDYWEILKTGGEIHNLFHPLVLQSLSIIYSRANEVNDINFRKSIAKTNHIRDKLINKELSLIESLNTMLVEPSFMNVIANEINRNDPNKVLKNLKAIKKSREGKIKFPFFN